VTRIADEARVPVIDIAASFARQPAPGALYASPGAHFNEAGDRLAAVAIFTRRRLSRRSPASSRSSA